VWAGLVGRRRNFAGPLRSFRSRKHRATWESAREAENVMVVAHPDDESLWGGFTLASDEPWTVLCMTHSRTVERRRDFYQSLAILGQVGAMLDLPDREEVPATREDIEQMTQVLTPIIQSPSVKRVMTHGTLGEYGHPLHRTVNAVVTDLAPDKERLWYFSFDAKTSLDTVDFRRYGRKLRAIRNYFGDEENWYPSMHGHLALAAHESPQRAGDFNAPMEFVRQCYKDRLKLVI